MSKTGKNSQTLENQVEPGADDSELTEYERERIQRIEENKAKMRALGLLTVEKLPVSGKGRPVSGRSKGKKVLKEEDDEEYRPNVGLDDDGDDTSVSSEELDDEDENLNKRKPQTSGRRSAKKNPRVQKKVAAAKPSKLSDHTAEDEAFLKAIALSIKQKNAKGTSGVASPGSSSKCYDSNREDAVKKKKRKMTTNRTQINEDEVVLNFFQFDEVGNGLMSLRDLKRMVAAHDFLWTDDELSDMIHCFDTDGDGKLSLDDFRDIVIKCNMLKNSDES